MKSISIFVLLIYWSIILLAPVISKEDKTNLLNRIGINDNGLYKDINVDTVNGNNYVTYEYNDEKEMNGADVFDGVQGSSESNESYLDLRSIDELKNVAI